MGLFEEIAANRRRSLLLGTGMTALLALVGLSIGGAGGAPEAGLAAGLALAAIQGGVALAAGDRVVLGISRAREIRHSDDPRLFNVVEEMAIAAGLPAPRVYLIEDSAPNAFATGLRPDRASLAITTGLRDKLDRDELQGVMAHEMSHVRNRDVRFATLLVVMVGTIALLCDLFRRNAFRFSAGGRSRRGRQAGAAGAVFLLLALLLSVVAPLVAKLIQLAASRRREFLADVSAAALTRNPLGLASALEKIAKDEEVLEVANRATMHLYIVNPIQPFEERAASLFSTHPPIEERVARLRALAKAPPREPSAAPG
ncbi:MAG TPA: M48 family metallopeptidase [Planctomycetota bacterium]|nr:M48 family metallopeptidase [Planctomycetota bacterium]